jgi:hypothetical protein
VRCPAFFVGIVANEVKQSQNNNLTPTRFSSKDEREYPSLADVYAG